MSRGLVKMSSNEQNKSLDQPLRRGAIFHKLNPFFVDALQNPREKKVITNYEGDKLIVLDEDTGEVRPAGFYSKKKLDDERFVKVFIKGIRAFAELSASATKLFEVFYIEIQQNPNKDRVYVDFKMIENQDIMKRSTFMKSLNELIEKQFIARTDTQNWYFINPNFVWNGDRLVFAQEYERVSKEEYELEQQRLTFKEHQASLFN